MTAPAFQLAEGVLGRDVQGLRIYVHLDRERYFGLDPVAAQMVDLVLSLSVADALDDLQRRYEVTAQRLETDLEALLSSMTAAGLLRDAQRTPGADVDVAE